MRVKYYSYLINQIKLGYKFSQTEVLVYYIKNFTYFLDLLVRIQFIKSYLISEKKICIFLWDKTNYSVVKIISTPARKFNSSYKNLKKLQKYDLGSIYLISTSKGIITHTEAIKNKVGGLIICQLLI